MEQIQELLNILKETPSMALWGISIYFLFILLKLASWVYALKVVLQEAIKRWFDYKEKTLKIRELEIKAEEWGEIATSVDQACINDAKPLFRDLLREIKNGTTYAGKKEMEWAIKVLRENKPKRG